VPDWGTGGKGTGTAIKETRAHRVEWLESDYTNVCSYVNAERLEMPLRARKAGFLYSDDREQQTDDVQTDDQEVHQGGALQQG